jgi:hypothetical protein
MWKHHAIYESRPRSVIVTLGGHLYRIPEVVLTTVPPKQCRKVISHTENSSSSQSVQKVNRRTLQPLQPWPKTFLSNRSRLQKRKKILFLHLQWYLHTAQSSQDTTGWLNRFNPANNRFVTTFNKLSSAKLLQQGKQLTKIQIQQTLSPLPRGNSTQWRPLLPKEGGLIQVDIGGHPPIPTGSKQFVGNLLFLAVFWS